MNKGPCTRKERTESQILSGHMPGEMTLVQAVHLSKRGLTAICPHISIFPVVLSQQVLHSFDKKPPELLYVYWFGWFAAYVAQIIINLIQRALLERLWLSTISSVNLGFRVQKVQIAQTKGSYSLWFNSSNLPSKCHKMIILELNQRKIWTRTETGKSCLDKGVFLISYACCLIDTAENRDDLKHSRYCFSDVGIVWFLWGLQYA